MSGRDLVPEIVRRVEQGQTHREIAAEVGISYQYVSYLLRHADTQPIRPVDRRDQAIIALAQEGYRRVDIARFLGIDRGTVSRTLARAGMDASRVITATARDMKEADTEDCIHLHRSGYLVKEIAEKTGLTRRRVGYLLNAQGIRANIRRRKEHDL